MGWEWECEPVFGGEFGHVWHPGFLPCTTLRRVDVRHAAGVPCELPRHRRDRLGGIGDERGPVPAGGVDERPDVPVVEQELPRHLSGLDGVVPCFQPLEEQREAVPVFPEPTDVLRQLEGVAVSSGAVAHHPTAGEPT